MSSSAAVPADLSAAAEPKAKGGIVSMLLAGLLSSLVAAGAVLGVGSWLLHSGKLMPAATAGAPGGKVATSATPAGEAAERPELPPSKVVPLEPMVVNLSDAGGRAYLRASISLRMADETGGKAEKAEGKPDPAALAGKTAALRDTTLSVLGAQTSDGLLAEGGVAGVKKRLRERYALDNPEVHVLDVYFTDFLVQRG